jgi:beta-lactamase regulating signal transducer with metallopeptidase domain
MAFLTVNSLITDQFISALCNTLVHSLWQGILLAAVTGLIIIFTRKASAAMRYNLLITALVLFSVGVGVTFPAQFKVAPVNVAMSQPAAVVQLNQQMAAVHPIVINVEATGFKEIVTGYLNNHHNTIVLIWFLIICAKSIQLAIGLWGVNRLKHTQTTINAYWTERVQQLAGNLAIKQSIALFESALAKVPMVIGNLKPVILMPIGLLTALSTDEVEAILVHELAHIKRRDYLVNLLQSLMEIIFFFNPAVLWVSQLIKTERENCCDDLALAQSSSKVNYIRALVSCEEYQAAVPAYAMAFPGDKSSLFDRVKRIAGNRNHSLNLFEKTALAVCLVVSGVFLTAFTEKERIEHMADKIVSVIHNINANKEQVVNQPIIAKKNSKPTTDVPLAVTPLPAADKDSVVTTFAAANSISDLSYNTGAHLDMLSACLPPLGVQLAALNTKTDVKLNTITSLKSSVKLTGTVDGSYKNYNYDTKNNMWYIQSDTTRKVKANPNTAPRANAKPNVNTNLQTNVKLNLNIDTNRKYTYTYNKNLEYKADTKINYNSVYKDYKPDTLQRLNIKLHIPKIADALHEAGVIKDKVNFSAFLNNDVLIVNGETQSEEIHQHILKKYQKKPGDPVNLSFTYGNPPGKTVPK